MQRDMYQKALTRREELTFTAKNLDDVKAIMDKQTGFIHADWCGSLKCEEKMKEIKGLKSRCILENQDLLTGKCVVCDNPAKHLVVWGNQY